MITFYKFEIKVYENCIACYPLTIKKQFIWITFGLPESFKNFSEKLRASSSTATSDIFS